MKIRIEIIDSKITRKRKENDKKEKNKQRRIEMTILDWPVSWSEAVTEECNKESEKKEIISRRSEEE